MNKFTPNIEGGGTGIYVVGKKQSGKTELVQALLVSNLKHYARIIVYAPTKVFGYFDWLPRTHPRSQINSEATTEEILEIWNRQKDLAIEYKNRNRQIPKLLLVFDDYIDLDVDWKNSEIKSMVLNGRHYGGSFIFSNQDSNQGEKKIRGNMDYTIIKNVFRQEMDIIGTNMCPCDWDVSEFRKASHDWIQQSKANSVMYDSSRLYKLTNNIRSKEIHIVGVLDKPPKRHCRTCTCLQK